MNYICIDYENRPNLNHFKRRQGVKYVVFIGAKQTDNIRCEAGTKIRKIKLKHTGKDYLDCNLIDFICKRTGIKDTFFFIVSKDTDFDPWVDYINEKYKIRKVKRIETLNL